MFVVEYQAHRKCQQFQLSCLQIHAYDDLFQFLEFQYAPKISNVH